MNTDASYFWSRYHPWFVEMGYPQLDIEEFQDGSWNIIQTFNYPVHPQLCRWQRILEGMKHVIPTRGFVEKFVHQIDTSRREFWRREEEASREVDEAYKRGERHQIEAAEKAYQAITRNPDLMCRIARDGLAEMDINRIRRHIPNYKF